jgi:hypothetical protein
MRAATSPRETHRAGHLRVDRNARFLYVHQRRVGRREQLCLRSGDGTELGWKDLASCRVMVRAEGDDGRLARAVLESAGLAGVLLPPHDLPAIAPDIPAGRLLAHLRLRSAPILIGWETFATGPRLLGTYTYPGQHSVALGYVDLETGALHPLRSGDGRLVPETLAALLGLLAERRPADYFP